MSVRTKSLLVTLMIALGGATGCGPIVSIPGGALSGEVVAVPADWSFTDAIDTVQIETRPEDPYSVNIWAVAADGALYFATGETTWAGYLAADPRVRLRVDGKVYELLATPAASEADRTSVLAAMKRKYEFEPDPEQLASAVLYRLDAR